MSVNIGAKHALFNVTAIIKVAATLAKEAKVLVSLYIGRAFFFFEYLGFGKSRDCGGAWLLGEGDMGEATQ